MTELYNLTQISAILKISVYRLREWKRIGVIKPKIKGRGQGSKDLYPRSDLIVAHIVKGAISQGVHRSKVLNRARNLCDVESISRMTFSELNNPVTVTLDLNAAREQVTKLIREKDDKKIRIKG